MEDRKTFSSEELEKVSGGGSEQALAAYETREFCKKCNAMRIVEVTVDPMAKREQHRCTWDRTHFWYVTK